MKEEQEYEKYLMEGWYFASSVAEKLAGEDNKELQVTFATVIFKLFCSPYYYFLQNIEAVESVELPPTNKQIAYARRLGINDPESYSRVRLSEEINKKNINRGDEQ